LSREAAFFLAVRALGGADLSRAGESSLANRSVIALPITLAVPRRAAGRLREPQGRPACHGTGHVGAMARQGDARVEYR
jgi:hypothetical protein